MRQAGVAPAGRSGRNLDGPRPVTPPWLPHAMGEECRRPLSAPHRSQPTASKEHIQHCVHVLPPGCFAIAFSAGLRATLRCLLPLAPVAASSSSTGASRLSGWSFCSHYAEQTTTAGVSPAAGRRSCTASADTMSRCRLTIRQDAPPASGAPHECPSFRAASRLSVLPKRCSLIAVRKRSGRAACCAKPGSCTREAASGLWSGLRHAVTM